MPNRFTKYWSLFCLSWQNQFVYRASLLVWQFRTFLNTLLAMTVWSAIFSHQTTAFGYSESQMITYIFIISILQNIILSTALHGLPTQVYSGQINYQLLKPQSLLGYFATMDLADKAKNFSFALVQSVMLYAIFRPILVIPTSLLFGLFLMLILLGTLLNFIITVLFGAIGFWSPDAWGPKFLFFMLVDFTSGKLFPLDILPSFLQKIFAVTPFPYLSYVQTQLFLGRMNLSEGVATIAIILAWIFGLGWVTDKVWKHGLRHYTASGQ